MTLADMRPGERARIAYIGDPVVRAQAIRFGIAEGADVCCETTIKCGPVVVSRGMMQYAIGRNLAKQIEILPQRQRQQQSQRRRHRRRGGGCRHEQAN